LTITVANVSANLTGNGFNIYDIDADNIAFGTVNNSLLPQNISVNSVTANLIGAGAGISGVNASNITSGTLAVAYGGTGVTTKTGTGSVVLNTAPILQGTVVVESVPTDTQSQLHIRAPSGALDRQAVMRMYGTFGGTGADLETKYVSSLRSGFMTYGWSDPYLSVYVNNGTPNDGELDSGQTEVLRMHGNGNVTVSGNISGNYLLGNGYYLEGITTSLSGNGYALSNINAANLVGNIEADLNFDIGSVPGNALYGEVDGDVVFTGDIDANVLVGNVDLNLNFAPATVPGSAVYGEIYAVANIGNVTTPGFTFTNNATTGIYRPAANTLGFTCGGTKTAQISTTGLDVTGTISGNAVSITDASIPTTYDAWTLRTSAADNTWTSVCYGAGLFVTVATSGSGNRVMTSPDGITWSSRTSAADNLWYSVCYGAGLFVAVASSGTGNRVMTSPDGITWTIQTSAADNSWYSVCYGAGLFVAVAADGTGNRVMTSPDGITWTSRTSAADNNWNGVCYGYDKFVAVANSGTGNRVMTSTPKNVITPALGIGKSPGTGYQLDLSTDTARKLTSTTWTTGSDRRIKEDIQDANLDMCVELVETIPLKRFAWKESYAPTQEDRHQLGWIAQDVEDAGLEKAVTISEEHGYLDFRSLNTDQLYKIMWGALQKNIGDVKSLKARVEYLENQSMA